MLKTLKVKASLKKVQFSSPISARERYLTENQSDVLDMKNFFSKAGLSFDRSIRCAQMAVIRDIHTPRRLYYYIQSVPTFTLLDLGMDRFDADMIIEDLRKEFGQTTNRSLAAAAIKKVVTPTVPRPSQTVTLVGEKTPPKKIVKNPSATEMSVGKLMDSLLEIGGSQSDVDAKKMVLKAVTGFKRERSKKIIEAYRMKKNQDEEENILDMQEFFRFAGLSVKMSRSCAEEAISLTAASPKKLNKYIQAKRMTLADLGMDIVDVEMVREAMIKAFPVEIKPRLPSLTKFQQKENRGVNNTYGSDPNYDFHSSCSGSYSSMSSSGRVGDHDYDRKRGLDATHSTAVAIDASSLLQMSLNRKARNLDNPTPTDSPFMKRQVSVANQCLSDRSLHSPLHARHSVPWGDNSTNDSDIYTMSSSAYARPTLRRDHSLFMTKLTRVIEDPTSATFLSSPHTIWVSAALATLPQRPCSVARPTVSSPTNVHTDLLLMRVASVLKIKH